jgi:hypothetical protein
MAYERTQRDGEARDVLAAEEFVVPAPDPALHRDAAHDVLAAEEFVVPAPDPALHHDEAHDVLAAEEFGMPAPDPALHRRPVLLPADPTGIVEPHDVLAAEEFALPAPRPGAVAEASPSRPGRAGTRVAAGAALLVAILLRKRRT